MQWDYPGPFTLDITVQESDIDGLGHANNASYAMWCERCAWAHSASLGLTVADYQRLDRGVAIHSASYHYYLPSFAREELLIGTWLLQCDGKLRIARHFQIFNREKGQTVLRGDWQLISVVLSTGKAIRMPQLFADTYSSATISSSNT
jgi:acyl-CoA thioester hydrolase